MQQGPQPVWRGHPWPHPCAPSPPAESLNCGSHPRSVIDKPSAPLPPLLQVLIQNFKAALGLPDNLAAPAHIECGRRILRGRMEASSRNEDVEVRLHPPGL